MPFHRFVASLLLAFPVTTAPMVPDFAPERFPADPPANAFFPLDMPLTRILTASGTDDEGMPFTERSELSSVGAGPVILGVPTRAILDRAFEGGRLVEETYDYYATDEDGNVWYFGEDVVNYLYDDAGTLTGTDSGGAWRAGIDGARPGWMMPAAPVSGLHYFQEIAARNAAMDEAVIWREDATIEVPGLGPISGVLVTLEITSLDPDAREFKYYAPGLGLVRAEEGLSLDLGDPELVFDLQAGEGR